MDIPSQFNERPHSRLGWWAVGLGCAFIMLFIINSLVFVPAASDAPWRHIILPFYGIFMMLCGLTAGVLGSIAIICGERSWAVCLALMPALFVVLFTVGEFLLPH